MSADYAALEARIAELEHQMRNIVPARIDAVNYGLSLVHEDTQAIRGRVDRQTAQLDQQAGQLDGISDRLDQQAATLTDHGHLLAEIIRRLPTEPGE